MLALPLIVGVSAGFWPFHTKVDALESSATDVKQVAIIGAWVYLMAFNCIIICLYCFAGDSSGKTWRRRQSIIDPRVWYMAFNHIFELCGVDSHHPRLCMLDLCYDMYTAHVFDCLSLKVLRIVLLLK